MRKRRIVELGLVLLCTNLMLVAAMVPGQGLRDIKSALAMRSMGAFSMASQAAVDTTAPSGVAQSVVTPKVAQSATPNALLSAAPALAPSPVASKSQATIGQNSIVVTTGAQAAHQQASRAPVNDDCANAYAFDLYPNSPVTYCDDNTGATEDCSALSGGTYREVWYRLTTFETLTVSIRYCGTSPAFYNAYIVMDPACPCSGSFLYASGWENTSCGDGNWSLTWANLAPGTYYWPLLTDSAGGYAEGPYCVTFTGVPPPPGQECPPDTMYGQTPTDQSGAWGAYTSGVGPNFEYTCYENFFNLTDKIEDVHWWGLALIFDPYYGWMPCGDPYTMTFELGFYQDAAGYPGTQVCFYVVQPTVTDVGPFSWTELYYYSVDELLPCCVLSNGWVSIKSQAQYLGCVFLWMNSPTGDFSSYQKPAGGTFGQLGTNLSLCLTNHGGCQLIYGACCDDYTGACNNNVEWGDCMPPLRFSPGQDCGEITPTCGIRGACCNADLECMFTVLRRSAMRSRAASSPARPAPSGSAPWTACIAST